MRRSDEMEEKRPPYRATELSRRDHVRRRKRPPAAGASIGR
jgi:hypothetical protein